MDTFSSVYSKNGTIKTTNIEISGNITDNQGNIINLNTIISDIASNANDISNNAITNTSRLNAELIHDGTVTNANFGYLSGVNRGIQEQIDENTSDISSNASSISTNTSDITTITTQLNANTQSLNNKLDAIPIASADVLGGVKIGDNLTIDDSGAISAVAAAAATATATATSDITIKYSQKNIISAGILNTVVLLNTGKVMVSGYNEYGQTGNGTNQNFTFQLVSMNAVAPYDGTNAVAISAGDNHTVVLLNTGEVMACGYNLKGQIGNGDNTSETQLVSMGTIGNYNITNAVAISAGESHTVVLLNTGEVMACGDNENGQLGYGNNIDQNKLVSMKAEGVSSYDGTNAVAISAGKEHTVVLLNTGKVMTCGQNFFGQLGNETSGAGSNKNQLVSMKANGNYDGTNAVAISAGESHTVVLLNTGEVMACGYNLKGQLGNGNNDSETKLVSMDANGNYDKTNAVAICAGKEHTVVLLNTGEVMACGDNFYGQLGIVDFGPGTDKKTQLVSMADKTQLVGLVGTIGNYDKTNAVAISAGGYHTVVLLNTGEVTACGHNDNGQLGDGTYGYGWGNPKPYLVSMKDEGVLYYDKNVFAMTDLNSGLVLNTKYINTNGINANGGTFGGTLKTTNIEISGNITLANKLDASLIDAGDNNSKLSSSIIPIASADFLGGVKIGDNLTVDSDGVISVAAIATATSDITIKYSQKNIISAGSYHTVVLLNTGKVMACGRNDNGRLGNGTADGKYHTLVSMKAEGVSSYDGTNAVAISTINTHTVVLLNTGEVMACGNSTFGKLGNGTADGYSPTLVSMNTDGVSSYDGTNAVAISSGGNHTVVLLNTGKVMACGYNSSGQIGDESTTNKTTLVSMKANGNYNITNAVAISAGYTHTVVLLNTGKVMACGDNENGQLGYGNNIDQNKLVSMKANGNYDGTNAVAISSGGNHTVVLLNTGEVMACGYNNYGQLGNETSGAGSNKNQLVSMKANGNYDGTNAVAISAGYSHTVVLLNTGEVMACGYNNYGQLGNETSGVNETQLVSMDATGNYDKTNAVAISAGYSHTLVLLNTGEVMACGRNDYGQLGDGSYTTSTLLLSMKTNGNYKKNVFAMTDLNSGLVLNTKYINTNGINVTSINANGDITIGGTLNTTGNATIGGTLNTTGDATIGGSLTTTTIGGTLNTAGNATINGTTLNKIDNTKIQTGLEIGGGLQTNSRICMNGDNAGIWFGGGDSATFLGVQDYSNEPDRISFYRGGWKGPHFNTANGYIGIGKNDPDYRLHIANETLNNNVQDLLCLETHTNVGGGGFGPAIVFRQRWSNSSNYWNMARIAGIEEGGYGGQLIFYTNHGTSVADDIVNERMRINHLGNVGIGTSQINAKLHIQGANYGDAWHGIQNTRLFAANTENIIINHTEGNRHWGFYCSEDALFDNRLYIASDKRIKENIVEIDDDVALQKLRDISCCWYNYKDKAKRGHDRVLGFIAQQVNEHLPEAVTMKERHIIPNIMKILTDVSWNNTTMITNELQDVSGIKYQFYVSDDLSSNEILVDIVGNKDNHFEFEKQWKYVYCYGKEVNDFHVLNKQKLFALNFSATQEIDRIQQKQLLDISGNTIGIQVNKNELELLKLEIIDLKNKNTELVTQNQTLQQRLEAIEKRLQDTNI